MISLEIWTILKPLQKLPKNVGDLGKIIAAQGFENLPKVQEIAQSGHMMLTYIPHGLRKWGEFDIKSTSNVVLFHVQ